jgi:hypothetical protein
MRDSVSVTDWASRSSGPPWLRHLHQIKQKETKGIRFLENRNLCFVGYHLFNMRCRPGSPIFCEV